MTNIDAWPTWLVIAVIGGSSLLQMAGIAYGLYLGRYRLDEIKVALKNSRYIYIWGPSLGRRGLIWSLLEISKITGMALWPKAHIYYGDLDPGDSERFPWRLKRCFKLFITLLSVPAVIQVIVYVLLKIR